MATSSESSKLKYHFNLVGTVKELIYPNKAILQFKLNEKEEKAILLRHSILKNGKLVQHFEQRNKFFFVKSIS